MDAALVIDASYRALMLVLILSLPAVVTAGIVGLVTAIVQAVTQIQDQGIAQAIKLIAVMAAIALASKWIATQLYHFADHLLTGIGMGAPVCCSPMVGKSFLQRVVAALVIGCAALVVVASTTDVAAAEIRWRAERFVYQAQDKPLRELVRDFAASQGLVAVISPEVENAPVNAKFNPSPASMLDMLATSFGLIWYYDGRALYVYPASDMTSAVIPLATASIGKLKEALANLGIGDSRYPIAYDPKQKTAFISGPRRYVDLVMAAVHAGDRTDPEGTSSDVRVFPLRYAWAADQTYTADGVERRIPGVVSLLRDLHAPRAAASVAATRADVAAKRNEVADRLRGLVPQQLTNNLRSALGASTSSPTTPIQPLIEEGWGGPTPGDPNLPQFQTGGPLNAVIVRDRPERMVFYESLIRSLDVKPGLIEIEVRVLEVSSDAIDSLGIDWRLHTGRVDAQLGGRGTLPTLGFDTAIAPGAPAVSPLPAGSASNAVGSTTNNSIVTGSNLTTIAATPAGVLTTVLGDAGRYLIARVNALAEDGKANILSSPRVLTADNNEAVLENINTFFVRVAGNLDVGLFNVSAGTSLRVTPLIISEGGAYQVKLAIRIEDGNLTSQSVDQIPVVQRSTISTQAFIAEGESLLIGGYKAESRRDTNVGVPGLSSIPILGGLFKYRENQRTSVERLFLLTPRIATVPR